MYIDLIHDFREFVRFTLGQDLLENGDVTTLLKLATGEVAPSQINFRWHQFDPSFRNSSLDQKGGTIFLDARRDRNFLSGVQTRWKISEAVQLFSGQKLVGLSPALGGTTLVYLTAETSIRIHNRRDVAVQSIRIESNGDALAANGIGIDCKNSSALTFSSLVISGLDIGLQSRKCHNINMEHSRLDGVQHAVLLPYVDSSKFLGCTFSQASNVGGAPLVLGGNENTFSRCVFIAEAQAFGSPRPGASIQLLEVVGARNLFLGNSFEGRPGGGPLVRISGGRDVSLVGQRTATDNTFRLNCYINSTNHSPFDEQFLVDEGLYTNFDDIAPRGFPATKASTYNHLHNGSFQEWYQLDVNDLRTGLLAPYDWLGVPGYDFLREHHDRRSWAAVVGLERIVGARVQTFEPQQDTDGAEKGDWIRPSGPLIFLRSQPLAQRSFAAYDIPLALEYAPEGMSVEEAGRFWGQNTVLFGKHAFVIGLNYENEAIEREEFIGVAQEILLTAICDSFVFSAYVLSRSTAATIRVFVDNQKEPFYPLLPADDYDGYQWRQQTIRFTLPRNTSKVRVECGLRRTLNRPSRPNEPVEPSKSLAPVLAAFDKCSLTAGIRVPRYTDNTLLEADLPQDIEQKSLKRQAKVSIGWRLPFMAMQRVLLDDQFYVICANAKGSLGITLDLMLDGQSIYHGSVLLQYDPNFGVAEGRMVLESKSKIMMNRGSVLEISVSGASEEQQHGVTCAQMAEIYSG